MEMKVSNGLRLSKDTGLVSVQRSDIVGQATFQPYPGSDSVDLKEKPGYTSETQELLVASPEILWKK